MSPTDVTQQQQTQLLTRHDDACLKTALAFVVVKQRLQHHAKINNNTKQQEKIDNAIRHSFLQHNQKSDNNNYQKHVSHMMILSNQELAVLHQQGITNSLRLDSLVTHTVSQLEAWAKQDAAQMTAWVESQVADESSFYIWTQLLPLSSNLLSPMIVKRLLSLPQPISGKAWILLETGLAVAPTDTCREALEHLLIVLNQQSTTAVSTEDLAALYMEGNLPWRWATVDLVQRLLTRLSADEEEHDDEGSMSLEY